MTHPKDTISQAVVIVVRLTQVLVNSSIREAGAACVYRKPYLS